MDRAELHVIAAPAVEPPLVVDLDGTLLRSDSLLESLCSVARSDALALLKLPMWLAQGRARLKQRLAEHAHIDVRTLPFDRPLLKHLRRQKRLGRRLVLGSGADRRIADAVAAELGLFDAVLASDGEHNLTAERKRDRLVADYGEHGFDYIGNSRRDLPIFAAARRASLLAPSHRLAQSTEQVAQIEHVFEGHRPNAAEYLATMRPRHWVKNLLLLVPLLVAHRLYELPLLATALVALLCFSLAASGVYVLNDLLDLRADRRHPHKRQRGFASGRIPIGHGLVMLPALWLAAALAGSALGPPFEAALALYVVTMIAYSLKLKDIAIVDALVLALGYTLRIVAGALAVDLGVSSWLLVCSTAFFFGLALLKRYAELIALRGSLAPNEHVRAYRINDRALIAGLGGAAGCVAVALLALYPIVEPGSDARGAVWTACALILFWIGHMWLMAHRGKIRHDPVAFALDDGISRTFGLATLAILLWSA
jgi:4-hydroxybenzoate polyprenyltransferase/phosphoserine phosphatase